MRVEWILHRGVDDLGRATGEDVLFGGIRTDRQGNHMKT